MFIWHTAGDSNVRPAHAERDGQEFEVDGPEWQELGQHNCRCEAEILSNDEEYVKDKTKEKGDEKEEWDEVKKEKDIEKEKVRQDKIDNYTSNINKKASGVANKHQNDFNNAKANGGNISSRKYGRGECAKCSADSLREAGFDIKAPPIRKEEGLRAPAAKDYGKPLEDGGLEKIHSWKNPDLKPGATMEDVMGGKKFPKGTVAVTQDYGDPKHPYSHMSIFDGERWVSDDYFPRGNGLWANKDYEYYKPTTDFYYPKK